MNENIEKRARRGQLLNGRAPRNFRRAFNQITVVTTNRRRVRRSNGRADGFCSAPRRANVTTWNISHLCAYQPPIAPPSGKYRGSFVVTLEEKGESTTRVIVRVPKLVDANLRNKVSGDTCWSPAIDETARRRPSYSLPGRKTCGQKRRAITRDDLAAGVQ